MPPPVRNDFDMPVPKSTLLAIVVHSSLSSTTLTESVTELGSTIISDVLEHDATNIAQRK